MNRTMSRWLKLLIGFLATLVIGWLLYGPLGQGEAYADLLQRRADHVLRTPPVNDVPNLQARISRAPLSRTVFLCGPTIDFQRNGTTTFQGGPNDLPGIDGLMLQAGGIAAVVWDPAPPSPGGDTPPCRPGGPNAAGGTPLLLEMLGLAILAWAIGHGLGWVFRRRPAKKRYIG
jgi:hypothetical protein